MPILWTPICRNTDLDFSASLRGEGFRRAALDLGYTEDRLYFSSSDVDNQFRPQSEIAKRCVASLLAAPQQPTGICVETDEMAAYILSELRHQGIRVPEQMSVIGFDDSPYAEILDMTTIRQDPLALGREAASRVLALLRGETPDSPHLVIPTVPVLRDTTAVPERR